MAGKKVSKNQTRGKVSNVADSKILQPRNCQAAANGAWVQFYAEDLTDLYAVEQQARALLGFPRGEIKLTVGKRGKNV